MMPGLYMQSRTRLNPEQGAVTSAHEATGAQVVEAKSRNASAGRDVHSRPKEDITTV
jgi:hypothetical protein